MDTLFNVVDVDASYNAYSNSRASILVGHCLISSLMFWNTLMNMETRAQY